MKIYLANKNSNFTHSFITIHCFTLVCIILKYTTYLALTGFQCGPSTLGMPWLSRLTTSA